MLNLDKKHNPNLNSKLISKILNNNQDINTALKETDKLFQLNSIEPIIQGNHTSHFKHLFAVKAVPNNAPDPPYIDKDGNVYPMWRTKLDAEFKKLTNKIKREVNIKDLGAVGDGKTDNTEAFKKAIGKGQVKVHVPEGVYITKEIRLPSWTMLVGAGKSMTTIKLHDDAPIASRLVTNTNYLRGTNHIFIGGLSLDWNVERLGDVEKTSYGGNHSSCLTFAHVTFGWVKDVEAINPGLHCFDVTSPRYNYSGDGYRARFGSKYIWLDHLNGYGFGDDGITTHHSDFVLISHSHMCDPSGRTHEKGCSNSNGIEIDDGSRNILLVENSTARCFGGVEIKAHEDSSAASNVEIAGHLSVNDNRSYNFRHIGHHKFSDPESKTAFNIKATNIVSIAPIFTELYVESQPRALVVPAYKNVVINNFACIGDPEYNYKDNPVIAIQYRARNVVLNNVSVKNFKKAGIDIKVFGGNQRADQVSITNIQCYFSAKQAIDIGAGIKSIKIRKVHALGGKGEIGIKTKTPHVDIAEFHADGYQIPLLIQEHSDNKN